MYLILLQLQCLRLTCQLTLHTGRILIGAPRSLCPVGEFYFWRLRMLKSTLPSSFSGCTWHTVVSTCFFINCIVQFNLLL